MIKVGDLYGSRFLSAESWEGGEVTAEVVSVAAETVRGRDGEAPKQRIILELDKCPKPLLLNATNAGILAEAWGDDAEQWLGNSLTVSVGKVKFNGRWVPGLQVKPAE